MTDDTSADTTRRDFVRASALAGAGLMLGGCSRERCAGGRTGNGRRCCSQLCPADVTLRIAPVLVELAPDHVISTIGYNRGSVPAPVIRLHEGRAVSASN